MKKITLLSTVVAFALLPQLAAAGDSNFYVGGATGLSALNDSHLEGVGANLSADFDNGWAGVATVGHSYYNGIRAELELGYRNNNADSLNGSARTWSLMGNALYDFANASPITPYIGAGAGVAHVGYHNISPVAGSTIDDGDYAPALQGIIGANYAVNSNVSVFTNYQYMKAFDVDVKTDSGTKIDTDYDNHTVLVGVRYNFGGPRPVVLQEQFSNIYSR